MKKGTSDKKPAGKWGSGGTLPQCPPLVDRPWGTTRRPPGGAAAGFDVTFLETNAAEIYSSPSEILRITTVNRFRNSEWQEVDRCANMATLLAEAEVRTTRLLYGRYL